MAENSETEGFPVQIVKVIEDGKFELDEEALGKILLHKSVLDTPTVSYSTKISSTSKFQFNEFVV